MNKKIIGLLGLFTILTMVLVPISSLAIIDPNQPIPDTGVEDALDHITNYAFYALLVVAVLMLIVAAWMFVTAGSNPETVKKARTMLMMALIGIAIAVLAKGTVALVQSIIGD